MINRLIFIIVCFLAAHLCWGATSSSTLPPGKEAMDILKEADDAYREGDNITALYCCHEFIRLTEKTASSASIDSAMSACYHLLGNIHFYYFDYGKAMRHYKTALELSRKIENHDRTARILNNLAMAACYLHDRPLADKYIKEANVCSPDNKELAHFISTVRKALYQRVFGDRKQAFALMKDAYTIASESNISRQFQLTPISELFQMYEQEGQTDSALQWLNKYAELSREYNVVSMMADVERGYMCIYAQMPGEQKKMLEHLKRYFAYQDSLLDNEAFLQISEQYEQNLARRNHEQISTLQLQITKLQMILIGVIILIIAGLAIFLWVRNSRRLRKAYGVIFESNREIAQASRRERKNKIRKGKDEVTPLSTQSTENPDTADISSTISSSGNAGDAVSSTTLEDKEGLSNSEFEDSLREEMSAEEGEELDEDEKQSRLRLSEAAADELGDKIVHFMETSEEWLDPDFSISTLASAVGSNSKYVSAYINDRLGKNFRTFINEYRILTALRRMSDTEKFGNYTIGAIAESVGFRSSTNFIAAFKKVTGVTPSRYLKLAGK